MKVGYRTQTVGDVEVFYREAGPKDRPVVLLLHGFPTSSHMFRELIPELAEHYRVIAPDLPGFGNTKTPARGRFKYTFDNLAHVIENFTEAIGLSRYALYIFDLVRRPDLGLPWPTRNESARSSPRTVMPIWTA